MPDPVAKQLRVVAIGGGTGLSTLLRGLKRYVDPADGDGHNKDTCLNAPCRIRKLSALVTVTDDGGSSGRLREDLQMLPPGDVRNCVAALSEDERLLTKLFQYRFPEGGTTHALSGHSFGNLFLAALTAIHGGDFAKAVQASSHILAARGNIYPATNSPVTLSAIMDDGSVVHGETNITASKQRIAELRMHPSDAPPMQEALEAIREADMITVGPGSLFTSLITNLLVKGIPEAIAASKAKRVYIGNLMTQANESIGLTASEHMERIQSHTGGQRLFDIALLNTAPISPALLQHYASSGQLPIEADLERIRAMGVTPVTGSFVHEDTVLRHDYDRVADALMDLTEREPS
ncbi:uridine diphosphate-N-acetylglucosamine-binding protein YvcK [Terriglobus sp. RCC_193]|uniref:gluconeogenesis factor YvcK family protein n=1 Tax=Terriglobus sp. RCC_193 TaxID=3239218 RepID=UPI003523CA74